MPKCYVLGGFLESELFSSLLGVNYLLWVNVPRLVLGEMGQMRLAPNGVDPGSPDGAELTAGEALSDYVRAPCEQLAGQLGNGYSVVPVGWDWRKSMMTAGNALAAKISAEVTAADPCSLVGHSAGGLVCAHAYAVLKGQGKDNLVRRIVTLGTPHDGTYYAVYAFSKESPLIRQLFALNQLMAMTPIALIPGYTRWNVGQLRDLLLTWPCLYELLPAPPAPAADPDRMAIYQAANWGAGAAPQQNWLNHARVIWWPFLKDPANRPPPWVLTTVSGEGYETPARLSHPADLGDSNAVGTTSAGDSVVTRDSAEISDSAVYRTLGGHDSQLLAVVNSGELAEWILAVRSAPAPAPAVVSLARVTVPVLQAPPIPTLAWPYGGVSACSSGHCDC